MPPTIDTITATATIATADTSPATSTATDNNASLNLACVTAAAIHRFTDSSGTYDPAFPAAFPTALLSSDFDWALLWVVDNGASRHYSSFTFDFIDIAPYSDRHMSVW